ncbi:MAG: acyltransferase family protein [Bryobacteraceae bacterium]|nr:acyltransferase family protein [Bryobacteraceae bacterium]
MDALRAAALLLGVLLHAALSFTPGVHDWAIADVHSSRALDAFVFWVHLFRMPLFFFLAGWFGARTYFAKGERAYLAARLRRVAVPLLVGWIAIFPFLLAAWIWAMKRAAPERLPEQFAALPVGKLVIGIYVRGMLGERFTLGHLWFLWDLALLSLIAIAAVRAPGAKAIGSWLARRVARPGGPLLIALPVAAVLFFAPGWNGLFPDERALIPPHWPTLFAYGCYFAVGWVLAGDSEAFDRLTAHRPARLVVVAFFTTLLYVAHSRLGAQEQTAELLHGWRRGLFSLSYAFLGWRWIFALTALFRARVKRLSRGVRYLVASSYTVYLVHLPIVVFLQTALYDRPAPWPFKYALISTAALAISLAIYHVLVRPTFLNRWLGAGRPQSAPQPAQELAAP